jgi:hypothetical protein
MKDESDLPVRMDHSSIEWTTDRASAAIENMGIYHGRAHVAVAEQFLDGPDVVAILQQVSREAVTKGMAACTFGEPACLNGGADRALDDRLVEMISSHGATLWIDRSL